MTIRRREFVKAAGFAAALSVAPLGVRAAADGEGEDRCQSAPATSVVQSAVFG